MLIMERKKKRKEKRRSLVLFEDNRCKINVELNIELEGYIEFEK